mmetsp:Transcript_32736/g.77628  ORF Transcript_32736/g.77628 Transcript_32736/m.77628 type:complete len:406 (+) Transcript_32736:74-1291(+)
MKFGNSVSKEQKALLLIHKFETPTDSNSLQSIREYRISRLFFGLTMGKTVMICVEDHFKSSRPAFEWSLNHIVEEDDELHVVTVLPSMAYSAVTPAVPLATAGAVTAVTNQWEAQRRVSEEHAAETLKEASQVVESHNLKLKGFHTHALPACGGACGAGSTLVEYANSRHIDVAVLGSRGHGAFKRSLMSVVGLGSVSDHCVHDLHCPVLVVRQGCLETFAVAQPQLAPAGPHGEAEGEPPVPVPAEGQQQSQDRRRICIAYDSSDRSKAMLKWATDHLVKPEDEVHIISVAPPVEYPVMDDASPGVCAVEVKYWQEAKSEALVKSEKAAKEAVQELANHGIPLRNIWYKALSPEGGASGVGESICHYIKRNHNNLLLVGNRGFGAFQRFGGIPPPPHSTSSSSS